MEHVGKKLGERRRLRALRRDREIETRELERLRRAGTRRAVAAGVVFLPPRGIDERFVRFGDAMEQRFRRTVPRIDAGVVPAARAAVSPRHQPGDRAAEAMFPRITEAYETLNDPARREKYDAAATGRRPAARRSRSSSRGSISRSRRRARGGDVQRAVRRSAASAPPADSGQPEAGADLHAALTVSFEESMRGVERQVVVTRQVESSGVRRRRRGSDARRALPALPGDRQGALGARAHGVLEGVRGVRRHGAAASTSAATCAARRTRGAQRRRSPVTVPPGVRTAHGCGSPRRDMPAGSGGRTGDLYVDVHVQPHPLLRREGDDLASSMPVAVHEAVLGARDRSADARRPSG